MFKISHNVYKRSITFRQSNSCDRSLIGPSYWLFSPTWTSNNRIAIITSITNIVEGCHEPGNKQCAMIHYRRVDPLSSSWSSRPLTQSVLGFSFCKLKPLLQSWLWISHAFNVESIVTLEKPLCCTILVQSLESLRFLLDNLLLARFLPFSRLILESTTSAWLVHSIIWISEFPHRHFHETEIFVEKSSVLVYLPQGFFFYWLFHVS